MATETMQTEEQYLTFLMGKDQYSIDILQVKEIIAFTDVLKIPMLPDYIKGVINLRGHVVPVLDLAMRFGKERTQVSKLTCIIIVEVRKGDRNREVGIMVDAVNEVISLSSENIEETPEFGEDVRADFISGMGRVDDKFIIMLNVARLLNVEDMKALEIATAQGEDIIESGE